MTMGPFRFTWMFLSSITGSTWLREIQRACYKKQQLPTIHELLGSLLTNAYEYNVLSMWIVIRLKDKRTNNDLQNIIQNTKDRATRKPLKTGGESKLRSSNMNPTKISFIGWNKRWQTSIRHSRGTWSYITSMGGNRTDSIGNRISDDHAITATDCPLDQKGDELYEFYNNIKCRPTIQSVIR
jgi:hypothetical protein